MAEKHSPFDPSKPVIPDGQGIPGKIKKEMKQDIFGVDEEQAIQDLIKKRKIALEQISRIRSTNKDTEQFLRQMRIIVEGAIYYNFDSQIQVTRKLYDMEHASEGIFKVKKEVRGLTAKITGKEFSEKSSLEEMLDSLQKSINEGKAERMIEIIADYVVSHDDIAQKLLKKFEEAFSTTKGKEQLKRLGKTRIGKRFYSAITQLKRNRKIAYALIAGVVIALGVSGYSVYRSFRSEAGVMSRGISKLNTAVSTLKSEDSERKQDYQNIARIMKEGPNSQNPEEAAQLNYFLKTFQLKGEYATNDQVRNEINKTNQAAKVYVSEQIKPIQTKVVGLETSQTNLETQVEDANSILFYNELFLFDLSSQSDEINKQLKSIERDLTNKADSEATGKTLEILRRDISKYNSRVLELTKTVQEYKGETEKLNVLYTKVEENYKKIQRELENLKEKYQAPASQPSKN